ncbi:SapC family protein, partial [Patescibacteria group bacterium]|nr:SapC family protein [Patescibacteria group bacterium]
LCLDVDADMIEENGAQKFFDDDGKPSQLSVNALEFCKSYHAAAQQTLEFSKELAASDILIDRQAEIKQPVWLTFNVKSMKGVVKNMPNKENTETMFDLSVVMEYYSR